MALLKNNWMSFLIGALMGGVIMSTLSLLFWSMSPSYDAAMMDTGQSSHRINRLEVRRDVQMRGVASIQMTSSEVKGVASSDRCTCPPTQSSQVESHLVPEDGGSSEHAQTKIGGKSVLVEQPSEPPMVTAAEREQEILRALRKGRDFRDTMMVGVVTTGTQLEWAESVSETWGQDVTQLVFYRGANSNVTSLQARALGLQLVELPASTSTSVMATRLAMLQHMSQHFIESHLWFLIVPGNTYIHMKRLKHALSPMDPHEPLILGPATDCLSGSGRGAVILLSQGMLKLLVPQLSSCLTALGKLGSRQNSCLGDVLQVHCVETSHHLLEYFVEAVAQSLTSQMLASNSSMFSSLLTYGPLPRPGDMYALHHHYRRTELKETLTRTRTLEQEVKELCSGRGDMLFSPSSDHDCSVSVCSCQPPTMSQCPPSGIVTNISPQFEPRTIYDYYSWEYFDAKTIYPELSAQPNFRLKMKRNLKVELQQALTRAIQKSSQAYGQPLKFKRLVNGWVRHNPYVGNEYIIDYLLMDNDKKWVPQRVNLVRPLAKNYISIQEKYDTRTTIHFIVPLSRVSDRFKEFMNMYESLVLAVRQNAALLLSVYGENDLKEVKDIVAIYRKQYPDMRVTVLEGVGDFSRARALDLGFSKLQSQDLAFVCDVDMAVTPSFLDRCRSNTVQGKRVYYPEFFKLYNMDYVYWNRSRPSRIRIAREHGHWAYYSFGMLCIYKSDYRRVGGYDMNIVGWGEEDVTFFHKIVRNRITVMRGPDVGLSHRWHPKECAKTLSPRQFRHCLSSQEENLADRRELARYVYEQGLRKSTEQIYTKPLKSTVKTATHTTPNRALYPKEDVDYKI